MPREPAPRGTYSSPRDGAAVTEIQFPEVVSDGLPAELELRLGPLTLRGTSVAARATAFALPELGVALDLGRMSPTLAAQPAVLLSHGHLDHLSGILSYLNVRARFHTGEPTKVVVPEPIAPRLREALALLPGMESVRKRLDLAAAIVGAAPGDRVELASATATAFAADHGVPALGWSLRRDGDPRPLVAYAGDGSAAPFEADPALLDAEVAILECTFVEENRVLPARLAKHVHLKDLLALAPRLTCGALVLAHLPPLEPGRAAALLAPLAERLRGRLVAWRAPE